MLVFEINCTEIINVHHPVFQARDTALNERITDNRVYRLAGLFINGGCSTTLKPSIVPDCGQLARVPRKKISSAQSLTAEDNDTQSTSG